MTLKSSSDNAATVNTELVWQPVDGDTPRGRKLLLINKRDGVAHLGLYTLDSHWTHWQGLPVFAPEGDNQ